MHTSNVPFMCHFLLQFGLHYEVVFLYNRCTTTCVHLFVGLMLCSILHYYTLNPKTLNPQDWLLKHAVERPPGAENVSTCGFRALGLRAQPKP